MADALVIAGTSIQAVATLVLVVITWRYVHLTEHLVQLQIEPRLEIELPGRDGGDPSELCIVNKSTSVVENVQLMISIPYPLKEGGEIRKAIDVREVCATLKPKKRASVKLSRLLQEIDQAETEMGRQKLSVKARAMVVIGISYERGADGRQTAFEEPYLVNSEYEKTTLLAKAGRRRSLESLEGAIVRPVES